MNDIFSNYNWTGLTILHADKIHLDNVGYISVAKGASSFYQLGIKLSGNTEISYNGISYDYSEGHILYLPKESSPDAVYKRKIASAGDSAFVFFDSMYELPKLPLSIPCPPDSQIANLFVKIAALRKSAEYLPAIENFYKLIQLIRDIDESRDEKPGISSAAEYIQKHITDSFISIEHLATLCGMTPGYFQHRFKSITGISPLQYINQKKCLYAEKLLAETDLSIKDVSISIGIHDTNYFSRFFKKHTNMTPLQYRKIYKKILL